MNRKLLAAGGLIAGILQMGIAPAHSQIIRIANQGDFVSLDPHSANEALQLSMTSNVYEPLVGRNKDLSLAPLLSTSWKQVAPHLWHFQLRKGVKFHDGSRFTAEDVVFSFERARGDGSDMKATLREIKSVRMLDEHAVEIETNGPFPILPQVISHTMIMSKQWCEEHQATKPVDRRKGIENTASFKSNGTGPFRVRERQPGTRTVFMRNGAYWGKIEGNAQQIVFTPLANPATRVAALVSGEVDVIEPVPVQDIPRINSSSTARIISSPELRTLFLGMDQMRDELLYSSVKGKNPFKDKRVRQAFYQAIDIVGIQRTVMRGHSRPTGLLVGPGINGWSQEQDKRLAYDVNAAKKLLGEAGYPNGFEIALNCPNDRYVNDGQICQSVAANLAKIGVKVDLFAESKTTYFPRILRHDTSFYLMGWTPTTYDSHSVLSPLTACPDDKGAGQFNIGRYCNAKLDELIRKIQSESNKTQRAALIKQAFKIHADDIGHLPLHQQSLAWGVSKKVELTQLADNFMYFKWMTLKP